MRSTTDMQNKKLGDFTRRDIEFVLASRNVCIDTLHVCVY